MSAVTTAKPSPPSTRNGKPAAPQAKPHMDFNRITDEQFLVAAEHMKLDGETQLLLRTPYRELVVQIPVRMDDGHLEIFHGYRVQHNAVRGPYKGGIRYHHEVDLGEVRSLSALIFILSSFFSKIIRNPCARIAVRWSPRATTETSLPASASRPATRPPIAPAP